MNRKMIIPTITLLTGALLLTAAAFGKPPSCCNVNRAKLLAKRSAPAAKQRNGAQTATIEINGKGFDPGSLKLKAGVPAKVTFVRKTDEGCAKEVAIKEYNINRALPLNEPVTVEFTPRKGEFTFACGMNMLKGKLIVE
jgi:plastocyanin domain-containing protein